MAIAYSDQANGVGAFALLTARAEPTEPCPFVFRASDPLDDFLVFLRPILRPTILGVTPGGASATVTVGLDTPLPFGLQLADGCSSPLTGYRFFEATATPGTPPPNDMTAFVDWQPIGPSATVGMTVDLSLSCTSGQDTFLATRLEYDSGFASVHVSRPTTVLGTASDLDGDTTPDLCDGCTDVDGDGFGDPGQLANLCALDNCPALANPTQNDVDGDGVGDVCDRCDGQSDPHARLISDLGPDADQRVIDIQIAPDGAEFFYRARIANNEFELYWQGIHQSGGGQINDEPVVGGSVTEYRLSAGGNTIAYLADALEADRFELFAATGPTWDNAKRVSGPFVAGGDVLIGITGPRRGGFYDLTPDGATIVYVADQEVDGVRELYAVSSVLPLPPIKLNLPLLPLEDVDDFAISPDASQVVYRLSSNATAGQLFSVPIQGGASTRLDATDTVRVVRFKIAPDSQDVVFEKRFPFLLTEETALFSVSIHGGSETMLHPPPFSAVSSFDVDPTSSRVAFIADMSATSVNELFSAPIDGGPLSTLSLQPAGNGDALGFDFADDGGTIVYLFRTGFSDPPMLYSVPVDGGTSVSLTNNLRVLDFTLTGDRTIFRAFNLSASPTPIELYSASIADGGAEKINRPLVAGGNVQADANGNPGSFRVTEDGTRVIYRADAFVNERYGLFSVAVAGGPSTQLDDPRLSESVIDRIFDTGADQAVFLASPGLFATPLLVGLDTDNDGVPTDCDGCTDIDGDGFGDAGYALNDCPFDNCPGTSNASQLDGDADGEGDLCDCAPGDPNVRRPAATTLNWNGSTLTWAALTGADRYQVTRGKLENLAAGDLGGCSADNVVGLSLLSVDDPAPGIIWTYLVRGVSDSCGPGTLGASSHRGERVNANPAGCT